MKELITLMQSGKLEPTDVMCKLAKVLEVQQAELVSAKARIAELKKELRSLNTTAASLDMNYAETCQYFSVEDTLSRTDDLSALAAHDADVRKAALLEAAKTCMAKHVNGNWKFDTRYECAEAICLTVDERTEA